MKMAVGESLEWICVRNSSPSGRQGNNPVVTTGGAEIASIVLNISYGHESHLWTARPRSDLVRSKQNHERGPNTETPIIDDGVHLAKSDRPSGIR